MKYTINGFNQNKLVEKKLTSDDTLILRWFIDFSNSKRMKSIRINDTTFFCVKYDAVIAELPILSVSSVKSIARRFDAYVEKGLLLKNVKKSLYGGSTVFFAFTDELLGLSYDLKEQSGEDTVVQSGEDTVVQSGEDTVVQSGEDTVVQSNINSSTINSSTMILSTSDLKKREQIIKNKIIELFGGLGFFSDDLIPRISRLDLDTSEIADYMIFCFDFTKKMNPQSLPGLFYKNICQQNMLDDYKSQKTKKIKSKICPVCNTSHAAFMACPCCGLENESDEKEIIKYKAMFRLPEEEKRKLQAELDLIRKENVIWSPKITEKINQLYQNYGIPVN